MANSRSPSSPGSPGAVVDWDANFRGNLRLWPKPSQILSSIAALDGKLYNERDFLRYLPVGTEQKSPTDTKRVREPIECLQYAGLAIKDGTPLVFRLTDLGRYVFSLLAADGENPTLRNGNRALLANTLIRGLGIVVEYRIIWKLMRLVDNKLTNRELNLAMAMIHSEADANAAADAILRFRETGNQKWIGNVIYADKTEERKAINPKFLLAGGGGTFITVERNDEYRRFPPSIVPVIDSVLEKPLRSVHISTSNNVVMAISNAAAAELFKPTADPKELEEKTKQLLAGTLIEKPKGQKTPQKVETKTQSYKRDPKVMAYVLREANGVCELCNEPAPFEKDGGEPFLEVHHVIPLGDGGSDRVENAVGICPNCHRSLHLAKDWERRRKQLYSKVKRLERE